MHQIKLKTIVCAAVLAIGAPVIGHTSDISILSYTPTEPLEPLDPMLSALSAERVDVWGRIRAGFGIPDLDNPLVTVQTTWYSSRPDYIQRTTLRASRYLYHVVQELEKRNMPMELALLPFIESAFNPQAFSTAKAAGMWQFIPSTGRDFNLKQNIFQDERRDVLASTDAALSYLQKLYGMFGDWQLALAAYNWGEGSVQRAINKAKAAGRGTDFNSLSAYMPAETRNYVPKLQAVKNIIATPGQYGITLPRVENQPYFVRVQKSRDIDVKVAAQLAELPMDEFRALNPQYNKPVIVGSAGTQILLPQSNAEKFKTNLAKWGKSLSSWSSHKVTNARERIESIAQKFKTTPEIIREVNNIPPKMVLKAGSTVLVPREDDSVGRDIGKDSIDNAMLAFEPDAPPTRKVTVKVGKKDTLTSIAKRNHVSVAQIKEWNDLKRDTVAKGESLTLHVPNRASSGTRTAAKSKSGTRTAAKSKSATRKVASKAPARKTAKAPTKSGKTVMATAQQPRKQ